MPEVSRRSFLRGTAGCLLGGMIPPVHAAERNGTRKRPNVIVIFTDDQGWADLSCQDAVKDIRTPNIDRLAREGVRMSAGYITAPQCVPSRAGLLTGQYQQRFGVDANGQGPLPLEVDTLPARMRRAGYVTGMVGKWHLDPNRSDAEWIRRNVPDARPTGRNRNVRIPPAKSRPYLPGARGFDDYFYGHFGDYLANYDLEGTSLPPEGRTVETGMYRLDAQSQGAVTFIRRHKEQPFFLYLAFFAPHVPLEATRKYLDRFPGERPERRRYALAMISAIDDGVGRILDELQRHGLDEDTLIFFISDNGAPLKIDKKDLPISFRGGAWDGSLNDPWVGEKGMLSEGGIRVPFLVRWKGTLPEGKVYDPPVISLDVAATALARAGVRQRDNLDGVDLVPYLTGQRQGTPHEALYWRFWNQAAIRKGRWKYLQAGGRGRFLFDLSSPQHEKRNMIEEQPELAADLHRDLANWATRLRKPGLPSGELNSQEQAWYEHYLGLSG